MTYLVDPYNTIVSVSHPHARLHQIQQHVVVVEGLVLAVDVAMHVVVVAPADVAAVVAVVVASHAHVHVRRLSFLVVPVSMPAHWIHSVVCSLVRMMLWACLMRWRMQGH